MRLLQAYSDIWIVNVLKGNNILYRFCYGLHKKRISSGDYEAGGCDSGYKS